MGIRRMVVERAVKNEAFRKLLLEDATAAIEKEFAVKFPEGVTVRVHEDSSTVMNLVLPAPLDLSTERPLSQEELEQVAGGAGGQRMRKSDTIRSMCTDTHCFAAF